MRSFDETLMDRSEGRGAFDAGRPGPLSNNAIVIVAANAKPAS
jgi:hypothetical protein